MLAGLGNDTMYGAWYRLDVPHLVRNVMTNLDKDVYDLDYVLYTDTDVLFFQDFNECTVQKPKVICMGSEHVHNTIINSGILYMNVSALLNMWPATLQFAESKKWIFDGAWDQGLYIEYYAPYATQLEDRFNWKGYWGLPRNPGELAIAHFHGPKPGDCLECYVTFRQNYKKFCKCRVGYDVLFNLVPDNGNMYERLVYAFRNFTRVDHHVRD